MRFDNLKQQKSDVASYVCQQIEHTVSSFGTREAGSEGERQTAEYLQDTLSSCCDDVKIEPFKVAPRAYNGWVDISIPCVLLAVVAYFFSSMIAITLLLVASVPYIVEHLMKKRAIDLLFVQKESQNVFATKKCESTIEKRLIFTASYDTAVDCGVARLFGARAYIATRIISLLGVVSYFALSVARWASVGGVGASIASGPYLYVGLAFLIFVPFFVAEMFLFNHRRVVGGGDTNLAGAYLLVCLLKTLKDSSVSLQNTEICVLMTGSKQVGNRGAKAFVDAHKDEFKDVKTVFVNLDTLSKRNLMRAHIPVAHKGKGAVDCNSLASVMSAVAKESNIDCNVGANAPFYTTDASEFASAGFSACVISAMDKIISPYHTTKGDKLDNLSPECIGDCFEVVVEIIKQFSCED